MAGFSALVIRLKHATTFGAIGETADCLTEAPGQDCVVKAAGNPLFILWWGGSTELLQHLCFRVVDEGCELPFVPQVHAVSETLSNLVGLPDNLGSAAGQWR